MTRDDNFRGLTKEDYSEVYQTTLNIRKGLSSINLTNSLKNVSGSATRYILLILENVSLCLLRMRMMSKIL